MNIEIKSIVKAHKIWLETDGKDGEQANFSNMNLEEIDFIDVELSNSIFINTNLIRSNIKNCKFDGSDFTNADFSYSNCLNSSFTYCNLKNTNFEGSTIVDSDFSLTKLIKTNFYNTNTRYLDFTLSKGLNNIFNNAILYGANFTEVILESSYFKNTNISKIIFNKTEFTDCDLETAIGIPCKNDIMEIEINDDKYIARRAQIKLLRRLGKIFYTLSILLVIVIGLITCYEIYNLFISKDILGIVNFNYFSWISLDIILVILGTSSNMLMNWIIRDDKIKIEEINNG